MCNNVFKTLCCLVVKLEWGKSPGESLAQLDLWSSSSTSDATQLLAEEFPFLQKWEEKPCLRKQKSMVWFERWQWEQYLEWRPLLLDERPPISPHPFELAQIELETLVIVEISSELGKIWRSYCTNNENTLFILGRGSMSMIGEWTLEYWSLRPLRNRIT